MAYKLKLFFEFYDRIKSNNSRSYLNLFIVSKNEKEQNLVRHSMLNLTLAEFKLHLSLYKI